MPTLKARIGGVWVDVGGGGGTDEVWIDPAAPAGTTQELWYDTDEPNLFDPDTARWNSAWGIVTQTTSTGNVTLTAASQAITSPLTFTAISGRRYRIAFKSRAQGGTNTSLQYQFALAATPVTALWGDDYASSPVNYGGAYFEHIFDGDGVTRSVVVSSRLVTGAPIIFPTLFYVEDVGPVSMSSNPPAQPTSVWTNMALLNGWTNIGGSSTPGQYRLLGDVVQIRGELAYASGFGNPFAVLPAGMRPSTISFFPIVNRTSATAALMLSIDTGGGLNVLGIAGNTQFGLGMISFSVTP